MSVFHYRGALAPNDPLFVGPRMYWEMKEPYADLSDIVSLCHPPFDSYIILFGARQAGKTSLMYRLGAELEKRTHTVLIELQFLAKGADLTHVLQFIGRELVTQLSLGDEETAQSIRDSADFREFLCHLKPNLPIVVTLDEIGALESEIALALSTSLRALHQSRHRPNCEALSTYLFLLAGGIELYDSVTASLTSPLRNISERFYLTDLSCKQSDELLIRGLSQLGLDDKQTHVFCERVYHYAQGQPYLTQRLGAVIEQTVLQNGTGVGVDAIDAAATRLAKDDAHILPIIKGLQTEGLWDVALELVRRPGSIPFSHFDDAGERLMLLGLIRNEGGYCLVRNPIYEEVIRCREKPSTLQLEDIQPGAKDAKAYEQCVFKILCRCFAGQLSHPERESKTIDGTERRDIIFYNDSTHKFWQMVSEKYAATNIIFECKNTKNLKLDHINQLVEYLGRPLGNFGVIVSRLPPRENLRRKTVTAFNRNDKVVLCLSDMDLIEMAHLAAEGKDPTQVIECKYVELTRAVQ